jgi:hypothetical protein
VDIRTPNPDIDFARILRFWYPLAATWLMMSVEGPFIAAIIARLPEAKYNLAAYGIAFSLALIVEAPIIMILSASVALVKGGDSYRKLRRFTYSLNAAVTLLMAVVLLPPFFDFVADKLLDLPGKIARMTYITCAILILWPGSIGYRRFYQGILIRNNLTRRVAYGTVVRLAAMGATAAVLVALKIEGAYVGASALSMGVFCEAVASRIMANRTLPAVSKVIEPEDQRITFRAIIEFYYPLALTTILFLGVHPIVTFFMGKSRFAIESFAVLPVVNSLVFIFRGLGLSAQELGVALMGEQFQNYPLLKKFALALAAAMTSCLALVAFTPFASLWYEKISGLSLELSRFAYLPTRIMVLLPAMTVGISIQRSILIAGKRTGPITQATIIEVLLIVAVLFVSIRFLDAVGVIAAAAAYLIGRLGANLYLVSPCIQVLRRFSDSRGVSSD